MTDSAETGGQKPTSKKVLRWIGWGVGGLVGYALSRAFGMVFWMPALLILATWVLLSKVKVDRRVVPMVAIVTGHTIWIGVGIAILSNVSTVGAEELILTLVEVAAVAGLVVWVLKRKSIWSIVGLMVIEVIGLSVLIGIEDQPRTMMVYVMMHTLLRIAGIVAAIYAIVGLKRQPLA